MIRTITKSNFRDEFKNYNREDHFSYEGLGALYDWLENYEEDTGCTVELDVIALCCGYTEYENLEELQATYGEEYETMDDIEYRTMVIMINDESFIVADF